MGNELETFLEEVVNILVFYLQAIKCTNGFNQVRKSLPTIMFKTEHIHPLLKI